MSKKKKVYFFDTYKYLRCFNPDLFISTRFGDVTEVPQVPTIVKSRPVQPDNANSILMKLNEIRHFLFVHDPIKFEHKKDLLVFRGKVYQKHRERFLEIYHGHPLCNVGQINKPAKNPNWEVEYMSIKQQLEYKYILCLEGNDVASNLKWVMSSNSLAVMPVPRFETWFMEGMLIPDYHFVTIKNDYSNLEEKLTYFTANPHKAKQIIANAQRFVAQFNNKKQERIISLLVLKKYFEKTGQAIGL
ncbi:MAG: glycosyl transferase family 90 [Breznakibacter sp.]